MRYLIMLLTMTLFAQEGYYYNQGRRVEIEPATTLIAFESAKNIDREELSKRIKIKKSNPVIQSIHKSDQIFLIELEKNSNPKEFKRFLQDEQIAGKFLTTITQKNRDNQMSYGSHIIVNFKPKYSKEQVLALIQNYKLEVVKQFKSDQHYYLLKTSGDPLVISNQLYESGVVLHAKPDFYVKHVKHFVPNDTYYSDQWHLKNATGGVNAPAGWDIHRGRSDINIAIIDDGIDADHEDLNVSQTHNVTTEPYVTNKGAGSHGTSCAGVAAAIGNNGKGMSGICPNCTLMAVKLLISDYSSDYDYTSYSYDVEAFEWAVDNGADVINNSWGYSDSIDIPDDLDTAIQYATKCGRGGSSSCKGSSTNSSYFGKGCVVVFAAGNEMREFGANTIEGHPDIISVGASDYADDLSWYSNCGTGLDVVAPSSYGDTPSSSYPKRGIWTTDAYNSGNETKESGYGYNRGGGHYSFGFHEEGDWYNNYVTSDVDSAGRYNQHFGGTSSAAPLVSGLAGLILSINPDLTYQQVREIIRKSAKQIDGGTPNGYPCSCTYSTTDSEYSDIKHSKCFGYGRVDVYEAMKLARDTAQEICSNNTDDDSDYLYDDEDPDCSCNGTNCRENYFCNDSNQCECKDGYYPNTNSNDGKTTCQPDYCTNYNDCAANSYCDYSVEDGKYYCYAQDGYSFSDGVAVANTCAALNCSTNVPNSSCQTADDGGTTIATCECNSGYVFTGSACEDLCANVTCNSWESCHNGTCQLSDGRCNAPEDCDTGYECKSHVCENPCDNITCSANWKTCHLVDGSPRCLLSEGRCNFSSDCHSGESCSDAHYCESNLCENVFCPGWKECNPTTGGCVLSDGRCDDLNDCDSDQNCENHFCVIADPCFGITCGSNSSCSEGLCLCDSGYHSENSSCVSNTKQVDCGDLVSIPENGYQIEQQVTIIWTGTTWGDPVSCIWGCDDGYTSDGNSCVKDVVDPCKDIVCGEHATCDSGSCVCDTHYHLEGETCLSNSKEISCIIPDMLPDHATAIVVDVTINWRDNQWETATLCNWGCESGYTQKDDQCDLGYINPCEINPCSEAHQIVCTDLNTDGVAECGCDEGYHDQDGRCVINSIDPCKDIVCGDHASCREGSCSCDEGYSDPNNTLICQEDSDGSASGSSSGCDYSNEQNNNTLFYLFMILIGSLFITRKKVARIDRSNR